MRRFVIYSSKFKLVEQILIAAIRTDPNQIFYKPYDSPEWQAMSKIHTVVAPEDEKKTI